MELQWHNFLPELVEIHQIHHSLSLCPPNEVLSEPTIERYGAIETEMWVGPPFAASFTDVVVPIEAASNLVPKELTPTVLALETDQPSFWTKTAGEEGPWTINSTKRAVAPGESVEFTVSCMSI